MSTAGQLDEAYQRLHATGPEFGGDAAGNNGLANHGPMAVEALVRRGHGDAVAAWMDHYVSRLIEMPPARQRITDENWASSLGGGRARLGDWTDYLLRQMAERPWREVLTIWWPRLLPGIAAGATHGVIRVGHAVRALDTAAGELATDELAHALAYWAARSMPLPRATPPAGRLPPRAALDSIPHLADQTGVIAQRLPRLADLTTWPHAQSALRAPATDDEVPAILAELVHAATVRYLDHGYGSPVLLVHTATAPNAVLHTLPALPRDLWTQSLAAVWSAAAAIVAAYEPADRVPTTRQARAPRSHDPVSDLLEQAAAHGDEHVIKFTDTAAEVYQSTDDPDALAAAVQARRLIASE